jgi:hypothetical protein
VLALSTILALTACGTTRTERGLSGAAIGAGLGAAAGEVFGNSPGKGALIGGAAGAATGVLTAPNQDSRSYRHREDAYGNGDDDCWYDRSRRRTVCNDD